MKSALWGTAMFFILFTGCTQGPETEPDEPYIKIQSELTDFDAKGGKESLTFSTNYPWSIETQPLASAEAAADASEDWYSVSPMSGEAGEKVRLTVEVGENDTYAERGFTIVVAADAKQERIEVLQAQNNAFLIGANKRNVTAEEQTLIVEVQTNVGCSVVVEEGGEWITVEEAAETKALETNSRTFRIEANTVAEERTGVILFRGGDSKLSDRLTIVQEAWADPTPELTALEALYKHTGGESWTRSDNWCSDRPFNEWYGVETDGEGHVTAIRLPDNNLTGEIPDEMSGLTYLHHLDLSHNDIGGLIRKQFAAREDYSFMDGMTELETVNLSYNRIEGQLPLWEGEDVTVGAYLRTVDFSYNKLRGSLNDWERILSHEVSIVLNGNYLSLYLIPETFLSYQKWPVLGMSIIRQFSDANILEEVRIPDFSFVDLVSGQEMNVRDVYSKNKLTVLFFWDPLQEKSMQFVDNKVTKWVTSYNQTEFDVIAVIPEGTEYREAALSYLKDKNVSWHAFADFYDADRQKFVLPTGPYPSYMLFDQDGTLRDDIFEGQFIKFGGQTILVNDIFSEDLDEYEKYRFRNDFDVSGYESSDYSMNGEYELLQQATRGSGVDLVLIGDAFTDIDIECGDYREVMEATMEAFFSAEPMKTYRDYFNVYMVYAVSRKAEAGANSALHVEMPRGSVNFAPDASDYTVQYRLGLASEIDEDALWGIIVNNCAYPGQTLWTPIRSSAVEQLSFHEQSLLGRNYLASLDSDTFRHAVLYHLAGKLLGLLEGTLPLILYIPSFINEMHTDGYMLNVSTDSEEVPWAHFIGHPKYPEVGVYEVKSGAYAGQVWMPSLHGIMQADGSLYFDPFCREQIVKRILSLAGEEYTFEKFLENDRQE